jgi:hypothetical protein
MCSARRALEQHVAFREGGGNGKRAGLDAIGDDGVLDRLQLVDAFDRDDRGAGAGDLGAHLVQHHAEVLDLGLARGVLDDGAALGERRRHHQVLAAGHGRHVEDDRRALQPLALDVDVAVIEDDLGAHRGEPLQVLIDRPRADGAAARLRHPGPTEARDQRAEHHDRRAHGLHQIVGRLELGLLRRRRADDHRALALDLAAELAQELGHGRHVLQLRDVLERAGPAGQERRGHHRQRGVLGAADGDVSNQAAAAFDDDLVHGSRPG